MKRVKFKSKILNKINLFLFGNFYLDKILMKRKNLKFFREEKTKRNKAMQQLILSCSKIKTSNRVIKNYNSSDDYDFRRNDNNSRHNDSQNDSGSQAYQTGQIF